MLHRTKGDQKQAFSEDIINVLPAYDVCFITDVEGNMRYLRKLVDISKVLEWMTPVDRHAAYIPPLAPQNDKLFIKFKDEEIFRNRYFVFGGDAFDKGLDESVTRLLVALKDRYPDRVFLLLGNRDINKLKLSSELDEEEIRSSDPRLNPRSFWHPADLFPGRSPTTYADWLYRQAKHELLSEHPITEGEIGDYSISEDEIQAKLDELNTGVNKLKWSLVHTMGTPEGFEHRRKEIAYRKGIPDCMNVSDEEVLESYRNSVYAKDGFVREYLNRSQLAAVIDNTLFVHGGLDMATLGFVPSLQAHHDHRRLQPLCEVPESWISDNESIVSQESQRQYRLWTQLDSDDISSLKWNPFGACAVPVGIPRMKLDRAPGLDYKLTSSVRTWVNKLNRFATVSIARWALCQRFSKKTPSSMAKSISISAFKESDTIWFQIAKHPIFGLHKTHLKLGLPGMLTDSIAERLESDEDVWNCLTEHNLPPLKRPPTFTSSHAIAFGIDASRYPSGIDESKTDFSAVVKAESSPLLTIPPTIPKQFWNELQTLATPAPPVAESLIIPGAQVKLEGPQFEYESQIGHFQVNPQHEILDEADKIAIETPVGPRDQYSRYRYRGGCEVMGFSYRPAMNTRTVVVQNQFDKSNPTYKAGDLQRILNNSGVYRILSGHLPWGDSPGVIEHPLRLPLQGESKLQVQGNFVLSTHDSASQVHSYSGLEIVDADTSYSGYTHPSKSSSRDHHIEGTDEDENRGNAACEVLIKGVTVTTELNLENYVGKANTDKVTLSRRFSYTEMHGVLRDGTKYEFTLPPFPSVPFDYEIDKQLELALPNLEPSVRAQIQRDNQVQIAQDLSQLINADPYIGHQTVEDNWWVKARLPPSDEKQDETAVSEDRYLLSKAVGYNVEYKVITKSEMKNLQLVEAPRANVNSQIQFSDL